MLQSTGGLTWWGVGFGGALGVGFGGAEKGLTTWCTQGNRWGHWLSDVGTNGMLSSLTGAWGGEQMVCFLGDNPARAVAAHRPMAQWELQYVANVRAD